jgi:hypothetical protein
MERSDPSRQHLTALPPSPEGREEATPLSNRTSTEYGEHRLRTADYIRGRRIKVLIQALVGVVAEQDLRGLVEAW